MKIIKIIFRSPIVLIKIIISLLISLIKQAVGFILTALIVVGVILYILNSKLNLF